MKKALLLSLCLAPVIACQKEGPTPAPAAPYPQTWQLVKLTGQVPGYVRTGADLPWQETYVFRADSTFTKTRQQGPTVAAAGGTFLLQTLSDGQYAFLTYSVANGLVGACTANARQETLVIKADGTLVNTWQACDGPGLEYQRVH
ncbi:hypothetical protein GKZ68_21570 (plasmid) [Hymenobacter sp. BRD128]|uniref:hypothetical protein n=1 Tax=Hymenobacter sp. BRD128 TaxID=2675878 RepID=UPI00156584FB|nr:hypothetical protein [Hymenobacter sp. BRD128]QKG59271.1 hypothetical protein GKZ68_21570 [Hymenobacter sp. BRD128]